MACDTFIKIAQKCRRHFVIQQPQEIMPYIEEILSNIESITSDLQPQQAHTFYEAVGSMIAAQPNKALQERLIVKYMELPNRAWDSLIQQAGQNVELLNQPETVKLFANILKQLMSSSQTANFCCLFLAKNIPVAVQLYTDLSTLIIF